MTAASTDGDTEYRTVGVDAPDLQQYAAVSLKDGEVIIYDQDNEKAWVQSPSALGLEFMR